MSLNPKSPPGRTNRKARAFLIEIARLGANGYTCESIREALLDAGVVVSKSTVQRELARQSNRRPAVQVQVPVASACQNGATPPLPVATHTSQRPANDLRSGKEIAASFVKNRITNPLLRIRSNDESSRH